MNTITGLPCLSTPALNARNNLRELNWSVGGWKWQVGDNHLIKATTFLYFSQVFFFGPEHRIKD